MASLATVTGSAGLPQPAEAAASKMWKQIQLPFEDTLYDVDFDRYAFFGSQFDFPCSCSLI